MTVQETNVTPDPASVDDEEQADDTPQETVPPLLRLTVVVLGVAIIIMLALIVGTLIKRAISSDEEAQTVASAVLPDIAGPEIANAPATLSPRLDLRDGITVSRPPGALLASSQMAGHELILYFKLQDGGDLIMTVDRTDGRVQRIEIPADGSE